MDALQSDRSRGNKANDKSDSSLAHNDYSKHLGSSSDHTLCQTRRPTRQEHGTHFQIPPACLNAFVTISMLITIVVYDRAFVPAIRRYTKNPRGITMLLRLGIRLVMHVIIMVIACFAARKKLKVARKNHLFDIHDTIPLTIFILRPQYTLGGVADNLLKLPR